jgi:hypothetical protein
MPGTSPAARERRFTDILELAATVAARLVGDLVGLPLTGLRPPARR